MLSAIRTFMQGQSSATLTQIALHLNADQQAVRGMIEVWERKGRMAKVPLPCGSCTQCDTAGSELYQWFQESPPLTVAPLPAECQLVPRTSEPQVSTHTAN